MIGPCASAWSQVDVGPATPLPLFSDRDGRCAYGSDELPTLYVRVPLTITITELGDEVESANITDVEVADFNGDGRNDIAVAWYATDSADMANNLRFLTVYLGSGTGNFTRAADIDLYEPNYMIEALSVFRNGSADIGVGDFDGDGDPDLAVTPFFGDELWFVENLGDGTFVQHLKYPFGFNSTGNFQTPPEAMAADFDEDGRDELVYVVDPIQYIQGDLVHFWTTSDTVENMHRVDWEGIENGVVVQWTRGLAIADFDDDGRPDLCFSGSINPPYEDDPVLVFWHDLNTTTRRFAVHLEYPSFLCSDVVAVQPDPACPPGVLITDLDGTEIEFWAHQCGPPVAFHLAAAEDGYAGYAVDYGMAAVVADVDGDGDSDLVTRQKLGGLTDKKQVEITLSGAQGQEWTRVRPTPVSTCGFQDQPGNEILRPRNLAVADLFGNTLPEVVAGFGPSPAGGGVADMLRVACWANSCLGDVTLDGRTDVMDVSAVLAEFGQPSPPANPNADLNRDGQVDLADLSIVMADFGCVCSTQTVPPDPL
jgi:hypothetical protein